jgi:hypothetical protein
MKYTSYSNDMVLNTNIKSISTGMIKHTVYKRYLWWFIQMNNIVKLGMPLAIFAIVGALASTTVVPVSAQDSTEDARRILESSLSTAFGVVEDPERSLVGQVESLVNPESLLSQFGLGSQDQTSQEETAQ